MLQDLGVIEMELSVFRLLRWIFVVLLWNPLIEHFIETIDQTAFSAGN